MFANSLSKIVVLGLALVAGSSLALPLERRRVTNPCSTTIARTGSAASDAAKECFLELKNHIFIGGKTGQGILGSDSGAHLASGVLNKNPEKAGAIDANLVMKASVTDATKTLWLDEGLKTLIKGAEDAQKKQATDQAHLKAAQDKLAKASSSLSAKQKKNLENAVKKAQRAVKPLSATETAMLTKVKPFVPNESKLYTRAGIQTMCEAAMKASIAKNNNLLTAGTFSVTAPNLGHAVNVRLLAGSGRINSCFPVA